MTMNAAGRALVLLAALAAHSGSDAFLAPRSLQTTSLTRKMSDEKSKNEPDYLVGSVLGKQLAWDEKSGRFFESKIQEEDCIPDEEFCVLDKETGEPVRLTVEEKERIFLDALQAYYTTGRQLLEDGEFDLLKEDLTWSGSSVVVMNRKETAYITAVQDYLKGTPSISDAEFDVLKKELQEEGSKIAVQTEPKCYIDTGICKATLTKDFFKTNLLYLPAGVAIFTLWLGVMYEVIEPIIRINPLFLIFAGIPFIYSGAKYLTENVLFDEFTIASGACPACGFSNTVYFGNILGVEGFSDVAQVKCRNCKETFNVQRNSLRASTLPKA